MSKNIVFIYCRSIPDSTGSGEKIRIFGNLKSYLKLNFDVKLIIINQNKSDAGRNLLKLRNHYPLTIKWVKISKEKYKTSIFSKLLIGLNKNITLSYLYPDRDLIRKLVKKNIKNFRTSIHHFEYLHLANAVVGLNGKFIWSNHDLVSKRHLIVTKHRLRTKVRKKSIFKLMSSYRKYFLLKRAEKWTVRNCSLTLCVSSLEAVYYSKFKKNNVKYLPWHIPLRNKIKPNQESKNKTKNKSLKILHLGNLNAMITYSSLLFLNQHLFSNLNKYGSKGFEFWIVGNHEKGILSKKILESYKHYNFVKIFGYVEDLKPIWKKADLQLIGSNIQTGIRTRIVESLANATPVLTTSNDAKGIYGLKDKKNILIANSANQFRNIFLDVINNKLDIKKIALSGHKLHLMFHNEDYHKKKLGHFIKERNLI